MRFDVPILSNSREMPEPILAAAAAIGDYHAFPDASGHFGIYGGTFVSAATVKETTQ